MNEAQKARFAAALDRLADDETMLQSLAEIAAEDAPELLDRLDASVVEDEWSVYAKTAHAVKGLLSTFETSEPVNEIQPAIDAAKLSDGRMVKRLHAKVIPKLRQLVHEIECLAS